jgi:hypothetical protein
MALYGIKLGALPLPLDAKLDTYASGDPATQLDVKKGTLTVGPLEGNVTGTEKVFDGGFRIELGWKAGPVRCTAFLALPPPIPGAPPPDPVTDLRQQLGQFAAATGLARLAGEIQLDARLLLDTRDLGQTALSISQIKQCAL